MEEVLLEHSSRYPAMALQDYVKLLYQSEFAGGHLIEDPAKSLAWLRKERADTPDRAQPKWEAIGGGLARLHIGALPPDTVWEAVNRLFVWTAAQNKGSRQGLEHKLQLFQAMCEKKALPVEAGQCQAFLEQYRAQGYPVIHHSQAFRQTYAPPYRVVSQEGEGLLPVMALVEHVMQRQLRPVIALDGCSGSGKSTLAERLQQIYGCGVVHMDDFFLQPSQRRPQRLAEVGGNIDYERFQEEVLPHLIRREDLTYRRFDCHSMALAEQRACRAAPFVLVEGVYAMHPRFRRAYDAAIFLRVPKEEQLRRIGERSGPLLERFQREWIPLEERYFAGCQVEAACDLVLDS